MINIKQFKQHILTLLSCVSLFAFIGCSDATDEEVTRSEDTIQLTLDMSTSNIGLSTRGSNDNELKLDMSSLQVLVFEAVSPTEEIFRYKAKATKFSGNNLVLEIPRSVNGEEFRIVLLAHAPEVDVAEGLPKLEVLNEYTFQMADKWNTSSSNFRPIPMWGESAKTLMLDRDRQLSISLYLALARVDVGLKFIAQDQDNQSDEVQGLDNFKLTSVRVYRTKNLAYVASNREYIVANARLKEPYIVADAKYNIPGQPNGNSSLAVADKNPLLYSVDFTQNPQGVDKMIREIYIPESSYITSQSTMDNVPCLVVGGYYEQDNINSANPKETFYRMDFAEYKEGGMIDSYKPIIRNHRYVFDIKSITNPGFPSEEDALKSLPAGIEVDVKVWDEKPLDQYVQGDYYFSVSSRKVEIPAFDLSGTGLKPAQLPSGTDEYIWQRVSYKTNLPLDKLKKIWKSSNNEQSSTFKLVIDEDYFWFGADANVNMAATGGLKEGREDVLNIKVLDMEDILINVSQDASSTIFLLDCSTLKVNGKYREGVPLNYTHTIDVTLYAPEYLSDFFPGLQREKYSLAGNLVEVYTKERKGIHFKYSQKMVENGTVRRDKVRVGGRYVNVLAYDITLEGFGTPTKDASDPVTPDNMNSDAIILPLKDLVVETNSVASFGDGSVGSVFCSTEIFFGYRTKRILTIGSNARFNFGYVLEPNSASRAFVDANINFGIDPNSAVTINQFPLDYSEASARNNAFHIEVMTKRDGMDGYKIELPALRSKLNDFKPDIILMSYATNISDEAASLIADYTNRGGVLIMLSEYYPKATSIDNMVSKVIGTPLNGSNKTISSHDVVRPLISAGDNDPILHGPFGNMTGKTWGSDGISIFRFRRSSFPASDATVYSTVDNDPCFFLYKGKRTDGSGKPKAFLFNGDGGFISNSKRYIGPSYWGLDHYFPFAINGAYQPIARTNYDKNKSVYNAQIFGNILAWAIDYAEFHGINSKL